MDFNFFGRVCRYAAVASALLGSASCVDVNDQLGSNLIPKEYQWNVFTPGPVNLDSVSVGYADSLSAYSSSRFTFGSIKDEIYGPCTKSTSFTLVPYLDSIDFGKEGTLKIRRFNFLAARDTTSTVYGYQQKILQNVHVYELKQALDSTVMYTSDFMNENVINKFVDFSKTITDGTPLYDGGEYLSFDFSEEFTEAFIKKLRTARLDSVNLYIKDLPGIYITTDEQTSYGGRINMFRLPLETDSDGYLASNFAELEITAEYEGYDSPVDTSFFFFYGPVNFLTDEDTSYPTQIAYNASNHSSQDFLEKWKNGPKDKLYIEGGGGIKPIIKAIEIKDIVEELVAAEGIDDMSEVVINKATLMLPYDVEGNYEALDKYPTNLSPTVRLRSSDNNYVSYAGLTDSSMETEDQGDINRSLNMYKPDISYHVQEILKLDRNDEDFETKIKRYDIWFMTMFEETVIEEGSTSSSSDYYNNLMYSSYYDNMMYGGYGGYGYGGYGYGYGNYGYGSYGSNYYNYYLMSMYASAYGSSTESTSVELDRDRYYYAALNGPNAPEGKAKPQIQITFSVPNSTLEK